MSYTSTSTSERTMPSRPKRKVTGLEEAFPDQQGQTFPKRKRKRFQTCSTESQHWMGPVLHWLAGVVEVVAGAVYILNVRLADTNGRVNWAYDGHRGGGSRKNGKHQEDEDDSRGKASKHTD